jgi:hypothetical protein
MSTDHSNWNRRDFLYGLGSTIGAVALSSLLACERKTGQLVSKGPLSPSAPMMRAKAKYCIFLTMEGGPSHIDTFDPKPMLDKYHLTKFQRCPPETATLSKVLFPVVR